MIKKIVFVCASALALGSTMTASMANSFDASKAAPIHWGSIINNSSNLFQNGKSFCSKKYIGRKTCIPAMNNTPDSLTVMTTAYASANAPADSVVALMGKDVVDAAVFTVQATDANGKVSTVYSGPAKNKEGIICKQDQTTKAVTCSAWA